MRLLLWMLDLERTIESRFPTCPERMELHHLWKLRSTKIWGFLLRRYWYLMFKLATLTYLSTFIYHSADVYTCFLDRVRRYGGQETWAVDVVVKELIYSQTWAGRNYYRIHTLKVTLPNTSSVSRPEHSLF
jgi:hypothetical protein